MWWGRRWVNGTGNFTATVQVKVGWEPIHLRIADFNTDGVMDIASISQSAKQLTVNFGLGDGTFQDSQNSSSGFIERLLDSDVDLYDMTVADLDNNGYPDIAFIENGTQSGTGRGAIWLFMNPGE